MSQADGKANGHLDAEKQNQPQKRSAIRALIQDFSPIWFVYCMNAGIISILLHQLPYRFDGLGVLSTIAFMVDFVLFIVFSIIFLTRFALYRKQAYTEITDNIQDLSFLAAWPIAWLTLSSLVALIVSTAGWGGHAFTVVAYVMWWFGAGWMLLTYFFIFITMVRKAKASGEGGGRLPPLILMPAMGIATVATTGGLIASYSYAISARLAVPIIIFSFLMVGIAVFTATFLYTLLLYHLFTEGWPAPAITPAMFVTAGPFGQSAAAIQLLSSAANTYRRFAGYNRGPFISANAAQPLYVVCVFIALLLAGMSSVYALLALYAMVERAFQKQLSWTMSWNSIIFPIGTLTTACNAFAIAMDSPAWRTVNTALVLILVILFLVNTAFMALKIVKGELLIVREDPRSQKQE